MPVVALLLPLAALAALRAVLVFTPGMWLWGLNLQRFLEPAVGWTLWGLAAVTLVPRLAGLLAAGTESAGAAMVARPLWAAIAAGIVAAALVLLLPDQTWFLGDFQMRQGLIGKGFFETWLPQSLPLDTLLHYHGPHWFGSQFDWSVALYSRLLGAIEAALLAGLATGFARTLDAGPAAEPWLAALVTLGAYLAVFTGYPKSTADQCVLTLAVALLGMRLLRGGRVHLAFGIVLSLALLDHRLALVFLPAAAFAWWQRGSKQDTSAALALATLPPLLTLGAMLPRFVRILREYDLPMHVRPGQAAGAWSMVTAFGSRMFELGNALLILAPAIVLLPLLLAATWRSLRKRDEAIYLLLLVLGFVPVALILQPRQGFFRDWDDLAPLGLALMLLVAWTLAELVRSKRAAPGVTVAVACSTLAPALGILLLSHTTDLGLARARAFLAGPPQRDVIERTFLWDFVGERNIALGRWRDAAAAIEQVAEVQPTRGVLLSWGLAAANGGDFASARRAFTRMLEQHEDDTAAWVGLGGAAAQSGDSATATRARARLAAATQDAKARGVLRQMLRENPGLWPALADSLGR